MTVPTLTDSFSVAALTRSLDSVSPTSYPADTTKHDAAVRQQFPARRHAHLYVTARGKLASNGAKLAFVSSSEIDYSNIASDFVRSADSTLSAEDRRFSKHILGR